MSLNHHQTSASLLILYPCRPPVMVTPSQPGQRKRSMPWRAQDATSHSLKRAVRKLEELEGQAQAKFRVDGTACYHLLQINITQIVGNKSNSTTASTCIASMGGVRYPTLSPKGRICLSTSGQLGASFPKSNMEAHTKQMNDYSRILYGRSLKHSLPKP